MFSVGSNCIENENKKQNKNENENEWWEERKWNEKVYWKSLIHFKVRFSAKGLKLRQRSVKNKMASVMDKDVDDEKKKEIK